MGMSRPVLPLDPIASTDRPHQLATLINERDRHAIHLRLNPQVVTPLDPRLHGPIVRQFVEARVRNRMRVRPRGGLQRVIVGRRRFGKTVSKVRKPLHRLVVELIGHQRNTLSVVTVIPVIDSGLQEEISLRALAGGQSGQVWALAVLKERAAAKTITGRRRGCIEASLPGSEDGKARMRNGFVPLRLVTAFFMAGTVEPAFVAQLSLEPFQHECKMMFQPSA